MSSIEKYFISGEELCRLTALARTSREKAEPGLSYKIGLAASLAETAISSPGDLFAHVAYESMKEARRASAAVPEVVEALILGYKLGISKGSGMCMNNLGAMYYMGDMVETDYHAAAELYEAATQIGFVQSAVNLGYIYEYSRLGERDLAKAHRCYALAAALAPSSEAVYKLGDMYSRGQVVPRSPQLAFTLYERSLTMASGPAETAQPAIRIAKMLIDPAGSEYGIMPDPLRALNLFQQAEVGLRIDIANGLHYYARRLEEAIEGQEQAREMLEGE